MSDLEQLKAYAANREAQDACYCAYRNADGRTLTEMARLFTPEILTKHWPDLSADEKPAIFAAFLACNESPQKHRTKMAAWLGDYCSFRSVLLDGPTAQAEYNRLPERFTVYRGATSRETESKSLGLSWSLDVSVAERFALRPDGVVFRKDVKPDDVRGLLFERDEREVLLILPHDVRGVNSRRVRLGEHSQRPD